MSDHKIIGKLSIWIINLIVIILALVFVIVYLLIRQNNMVGIKEEEPIAVCGTEDPMDKAYTNVDIAENLFKANCSACHHIHQNSTGPKLAGIFDRIPDYNWFDLFVQNEDSLIRAKDKYLLNRKKYAVEIDFTHQFTELNQTETKRLKQFILINE